MAMQANPFAPVADAGAPSTQKMGFSADFPRCLFCEGGPFLTTIPPSENRPFGCYKCEQCRMSQGSPSHAKAGCIAELSTQHKCQLCDTEQLAALPILKNSSMQRFWFCKVCSRQDGSPFLGYAEHAPKSKAALEAQQSGKGYKRNYNDRGQNGMQTLTADMAALNSGILKLREDLQQFAGLVLQEFKALRAGQNHA
jgi:hypothetical protein